MLIFQQPDGYQAEGLIVCNNEMKFSRQKLFWNRSMQNQYIYLRLRKKHNMPKNKSVLLGSMAFPKVTGGREIEPNSLECCLRLHMSIKIKLIVIVESQPPARVMKRKLAGLPMGKTHLPPWIHTHWKVWKLGCFLCGVCYPHPWTIGQKPRRLKKERKELVPPWVLMSVYQLIFGNNTNFVGQKRPIFFTCLPYIVPS